jgi:6-phosphogluconolactonase
MTNRKVLIFENSFKLTNFLLKQFFRIAEEAIKKYGRFTVALSGGKSPMEFYVRLAGAKDFSLWSKTHIFIVDERFVPQDHPDSNFRMLKELLLNDILIPEENIHAIPTSKPELNQNREDYESHLTDFFHPEPGDFPRFDFILLGVGEDGHTASLFPHHKETLELEQFCVSLESPNINYPRLSMTLPVINHAKHIFFIVVGEKKAPVIKEMIKDKKIFPASLIHPLSGELMLLMDKEAARQIPYKDGEHFEEAIII